MHLKSIQSTFVTLSLAVVINVPAGARLQLGASRLGTG